MRRRYLFGWGILLALAGCHPSDPSPYPILNKELRYFSVFSRWSQNARVYRDLDNVLFIDVTYHAMDFRKAYVAEIARMQHLSLDAQKTLLAEETDDFMKYVTFTVNLYTPVWDWNDLEKTNSIWRVTFTDSALHDYTPFSIHVISKHDSQAKYFFPYMNTWSVCYRIRFRRGDMQPMSDGTFELGFSSVVGAKRFKFEDPQLVTKTVSTESLKEKPLPQVPPTLVPSIEAPAEQPQ